MSNFNTPVLFLIFNRPDTTQKVFDQIRNVMPKFLYIAADGPRPNKQGEKEKCEQTRAIISQIDWDCDLKTLFREENIGCKYAVTSAITWFFDNVEEGIILEDDCLPDLSFFEYCNNLLEKYRFDNQIGFIGGNYFQKKKKVESSFYFSNYAGTWGWASWKRVWQHFDVDMKGFEIEKFDEYFSHIFNSNAEKRFWKKIFYKVCNRMLNAWDYQLVFTLWYKGLLSISPSKNLVSNLGFQNNATHFFLEDSYRSKLKCERMLFPLKVPDIVEPKRYIDKLTFKNVYSHSLTRATRILFENSPSKIFYYVKAKLKKEY